MITKIEAEATSNRKRANETTKGAGATQMRRTLYTIANRRDMDARYLRWSLGEEVDIR